MRRNFATATVCRFLIVGLLAFFSLVSRAQTTVTPLHPDGVYAIGEKIVWNVTTNVPSITYTLRKNGLTTYKTDSVTVVDGKAAIETSLDEPGAVLLQINTAAGAGRRGGPGGGGTNYGALVAPNKIQPASPRPADFDAFWDSKIKLLHEIPANPVIEAADGGRAGVEYYKVQLDGINNTKIYGQLAKPPGAGKFPAVLQLQWAGQYPLQKAWVTDRAAKGWLALNIEPHPLPIDQPANFYTSEPSIRNYQAIGQDDREKSYFLRMYLSAYRALDYLADRPDWDGKTLVVQGTSMGGQQTVCIAGLHPKVTALLACVPSSCDVTGPLHDRAAGFPDWARDARTKNNPKIVETAQYFDPVNFASRIKAPALIAMGFIDETCPPAGVWAAINQIPGEKEPVLMINSPHQDNPRGVQDPYNRRADEWLAALAKGEKPAARK